MLVLPQSYDSDYTWMIRLEEMSNAPYKVQYERHLWCILLRHTLLNFDLFTNFRYYFTWIKRSMLFANVLDFSSKEAWVGAAKPVGSLQRKNERGVGILAHTTYKSSTRRATCIFRAPFPRKEGRKGILSLSAETTGKGLQ